MMRKYFFMLLLGLLAFCFSAGQAQAASVCFTCHDKQTYAKRIVHKPLANGECVSCHNPHAARYPGLLQKTGAKLCFSCHREKQSSFAKGIAHEPVKKGECLACHDPHASDSNGLMKGKGMAVCFTCHKDLPRSYKITHPPFAKGQCSNCHEPHNAENPLLLKIGKEGNICVSCHTSADVRGAHKGFPKEAKDCLSCHDPHGSAKKGMIRDVLHKPFARGCDDCHKAEGGKVSTRICLGCHAKVVEQMLYTHSHLTGGAGNACTNCHTPHAGDNAGLLKGNQRQVCRACHPGTLEVMANTEFGHPDNVVCSNCHTVHGSDELAMLKKGSNDTCSGCHESQGAFSHPVGDKVRDPRTGQPVTCVSCHYPHGTGFKNNLKDDAGKELCVQCHRDK